MRDGFGRENINGPQIFFQKIVSPYGVAQLNYKPFGLCSMLRLRNVPLHARRNRPKTAEFRHFRGLFYIVA